MMSKTPNVEEQSDVKLTNEINIDDPSVSVAAESNLGAKSQLPVTASNIV